MIRAARRDDDRALARLDFEAYEPFSTIAPRPSRPAPAFFAGARPEDTLVAEAAGGALAGYLRLRHPTPQPSSAHVLQINGLAVHPDHRRAGVGRALLGAALAEARSRGMRRVTLRVLAPNAAARALYEACGFVVEGVLRGEFHLEGEDVDDIFMAYTIA